MRRDFTPHEEYLFEQHMIRNGNLSVLDSMERTTFTFNGVTTPLHSKESIENRRKYPRLGSYFTKYDKLYAFLSQVPGGTELLAKHEKELDEYITTGAGDRESFLIRWFEGELDRGFHYREHNDELFLAAVQDEVGQLFRFNPTSGRCFWFPLNEDKCFSVWYAPDPIDGDQLQMKLEQRAEDGSMGPHCELIFDESYGTADLSYKAIHRTICEIYEDAGLGTPSEFTVHDLTEQVMSVFGLKKKALEDQIISAEGKKSSASFPDKSLSQTTER